MRRVDGYSQIISERISTNGGATWGNEIWAVAQAGGGSQRPGMSQMARMADGRYILVYEVVGTGLSDVHYKISNDGINWPSGLGTNIPCQHCGPFVASVRDGRLFVTSCENQISYSDDLGATWQKIDPPAWDLGWNNTWPALYQTKPEEIGAMITWSGVHIRFGTLLPRPDWPQVFTHNFSTGDNGWSRYGQNIGFIGGNYALNNSSSTYSKALTGSQFWFNGTLEGDVLISTPGNAGLMFRTTNPDYDGPDAAFGYYVGLDSSGSVVLGRQQNSWTELSRANMTIPLNTWHHIKAVFSGSSLTVYVDDMTAPKITRSDSTFVRGQIGVRAFHCNAQFRNISFSNAIPPVRGTGAGLLGDYFEADDLVTPRFSRIDPVIDFDWGRGPNADSSIATNHFRIRWQGELQPQFTETYTLYVPHNKGAQLWLDNQLLVDQWTSTNTVGSATKALVAGQKYKVRLYLEDSAGNDRLQLAWSSPSTPWSVIPQSQLYLPTVPSPTISQFGTTSNGTFQLRFGGILNSTYSIWASTNLNQWFFLGTADQENPGNFSFTDFEATNLPFRFYQLRWP